MQTFLEILKVVVDQAGGPAAIVAFVWTVVQEIRHRKTVAPIVKGDK